MRRLALLLVFIAGHLSAAARPEILPDGLYAKFSTARGVFIAELYYEQAPMTCGSFVGLAEGTIAAKEGKPFYADLRWYRVVPDFVIQSGDPTNPGGGIQDRPKATPEEEAAGHPYNFPDEIARACTMTRRGCSRWPTAGPTRTAASSSSPWARRTGSTTSTASSAASCRASRCCRSSSRTTRSPSTSCAWAPTRRPSRRTRPRSRGGSPPPGNMRGPPPPDPRRFSTTRTRSCRRTWRARRISISSSPTSSASPAGGFTGAPSRKFTPTHPGQKLGEFNAELAQRLGVEPEGVVVSYYADLDTWMIWIGAKWLPRFMGRTGSREEFVETGTLMKQKDTFIADAKRRAAAAAARSRAAGRDVNDAQLLKLTVDEVLDGFILLYETKTTP